MVNSKVIYPALLFVLTCSTSVFAEQYVAGNHGQVFVHGTLTESACQLQMETTDQSVDLGNIETSSLKYLGERGRAVEFNIQLVDCFPAYTQLLNERTDTSIWSTSQPGVQIQFLAPTTQQFPNLVNVVGAKGLALELLNKEGHIINLGEKSSATLLTPPQDTLKYYVVPVRVGSLEPNAFQAIISFELIYE
jgi:type 1 fimbria pilin